MFPLTFFRTRNCVSYARIQHVLDACDQVSHLSRAQARLQFNRRRPNTHFYNLPMRTEPRPGGDMRGGGRREADKTEVRVDDLIPGYHVVK